MTIFHTITGVIVAISLVTDDFGNQVSILDNSRGCIDRAIQFFKS